MTGPQINLFEIAGQIERTYTTWCPNLLQNEEAGVMQAYALRKELGSWRGLSGVGG